MREGDEYKMWYSGKDSVGTWRIGYATSDDGIHWAKYEYNPVLDPGGEWWNNVGVWHPYVLKEDSLYKMWLVTQGDDGSGPLPYMAYATSSDGIDWTWHANNPLFGLDGDEVWFWRPAVLHVGAEYQMWYSVWSNDESQTRHATSLDGIAWSKSGAPVLTGTSGAWDEGLAANPFVVHAGTYLMWYDNGYAIGLASSSDGISWTKVGTEPVLTPGDPAL
jgi:predicted GH43/DUF377 family glycosyl hydrolase